MLSPTGLWEAFSRASHLFALCDRHGYRLAGRIQGADTGSSILDNPVGDRWLAVGDAASAFDPLSSKGIANALYTGIKGAEAVLAARTGDATALSRYAEHIREIHRVYRGHLAAFYGMERRWPDAPFWRRRQSNSHAAAEA